MAAAETPAPGTEYGPCVEDCAHRDCTCSRREAATLCRLCGKPIGYQVRWYSSVDDLGGTVPAVWAEKDLT